MGATVKQDQDFNYVIRARHSVRQYDPAVKIDREELIQIMEEATLAPSSNNLQSWRFLVIEDQAAKERLLPIAYHQRQIVDASAVIAVLGDVEAFKQAEVILDAVVKATAGAFTQEMKEARLTHVVNMHTKMGRKGNEEVALVDGGLVALQLMLAAKAKGYDTVPMSGFNKQQFHSEFHVPDTYVPVLLIALGKAAVPGTPSPRLPIDRVTFWNDFIPQN